ncbi:MAG: hypothetical protein AAGC93_26120 [Cyanobacteria bacterium P01_F01_bin.53]
MKESLIRAGDEITVIGNRTSAESPPVLEKAVVSDKAIKQILSSSIERLKYGFLLLFPGLGLLIAASQIVDSSSTERDSTEGE